MQYSPKLKKAIAEINKILQQHDVAGLVVLHTPGHSEFILRLDPSYSCVKFNGNEIRVRAKLQEDFKGDRKAWQKTLEDSSNMLNMMAETGLMVSSQVATISEMVDRVVDAKHEDGGFTSHDQQNN